MVQITKEVETCEECPHHKSRKVYTSDSWDDVRAIKCSVLDRDVHAYLDWYDKSTIPSVCPFNLKNKDKVVGDVNSEVANVYGV